MKKEEVLQEVIRLICENGLAMSDVERGLAIMPAKEKFDIAVKDERGYINRLPFALHSSVDRCNIVGIYPIKDCDHYIELAEEPYIHGGKIDRHKLPKERYMKRLSEIIKPLNNALAELGAPPMQGIYHARPDDSSLLTYITVMFGDDGTYKVFPTSRFTPAKCRCVIKP